MCVPIARRCNHPHCLDIGGSHVSTNLPRSDEQTNHVLHHNTKLGGTSNIWQVTVIPAVRVFGHTTNKNEHIKVEERLVCEKLFECERTKMKFCFL